MQRQTDHRRLPGRRGPRWRLRQRHPRQPKTHVSRGLSKTRPSARLSVTDAMPPARQDKPRSSGKFVCRRVCLPNQRHDAPRLNSLIPFGSFHGGGYKRPAGDQYRLANCDTRNPAHDHTGHVSCWRRAAFNSHIKRIEEAAVDSIYTDLRLRGTDEWTEVLVKERASNFVTTLLTSFTYDRA